MSTKKDWKDNKVNVKQLNLDLQNPRIPQHVKEHNDINQIRNYLLEKEDILTIATSIANNGYHRSAVAIVCEEGGQLIVLDGNRRLAACQLLLNPKLATTARAKKQLENLSKTLDKKQLKSVKIAIAPSRKDAEKEIWDIHVKQLLKPWEVLQKLRMYQRLIGSGEYNIVLASSEYGITETKFKQELAKLYFYERILGLVDGKGEDELLKSGFNKIDRLILSSNGKKLLNYVVNNDGSIAISNQKDFDEKLKKLIPFIITPGKISAQANQDELIDIAYSVIDPTNFQKKAPTPAPTVKTTKAKPATATAKATPGTIAKPDWITDGEYKKYKGADRVKEMLKEMKKLEPKENENVLLVSLRVLFELSLYHKLEETGHIKKIVADYKASVKAENAKRAKAKKPIITIKKNWSPSFRGMLTYILDTSIGVIGDPHARNALEKIVKGSTNFVEDLNVFIHNVRYTPAKGESEKVWKQLGRLLFDIIEKIK